MKKYINIAIDGPSGAGKSSMAKIIAKKLGFLYLDTGAMYRAIGLKVYRAGIKLTDIMAIEELLEKTELQIKYENSGQCVFLDGEDVSEAIREHHISKVASDVSAIPCVRLKMIELQRKIAKGNDIILDGRDIGTFVLPNAEYKFFLTADLKVRAKRRFDEIVAKGMKADLEQIEKDIEMRDYNDINRELAPLKRAEDAIFVDSTFLTIEETCEAILGHLKDRVKI